VAFFVRKFWARRPIVHIQIVLKGETHEISQWIGGFLGQFFFRFFGLWL